MIHVDGFKEELSTFKTICSIKYNLIQIKIIELFKICMLHDLNKKISRRGSFTYMLLCALYLFML